MTTAPNTRYSSLKNLTVFLTLLALFTAAGCATPPNFGNRSSEQLHAELCLGSFDRVASVSGSLWVKLEAKSGSGQFPANVLVDNVGNATIEVTDLFGGVLGVLKVEGGRFSYRGQNANNGVIQEIIRKQNLFGLKPLEFSQVFLGKLPCFENFQSARVHDAEVVFTNSSREVEKFTVRSWGSRNLVEKLESRGLSLEASDFEDPHGLPKNWTVRSKVGTANIRWRDRKVEAAVR